MGKLRYKTFAWPENPERYRIESERAPIYNVDEAGNAVFDGFGPRKRVISGSGCFIGSSAYANFKALEALMADETAGELVHPVWGEMTVFFTGLTMEQEPRANYVAYRFTFQEAGASEVIPE